jgi:hypothetical protein
MGAGEDKQAAHVQTKYYGTWMNAHIVLEITVHTLGQVQAHIYAQILHKCILPSSPIGRANKETTSQQRLEDGQI